jgi:hypothetical protein
MYCGSGQYTHSLLAPHSHAFPYHSLKFFRSMSNNASSENNADRVVIVGYVSTGFPRHALCHHGELMIWLPRCRVLERTNRLSLVSYRSFLVSNGLVWQSPLSPSFVEPGRIVGRPLHLLQLCTRWLPDRPVSSLPIFIGPEL